MVSHALHQSAEVSSLILVVALIIHLPDCASALERFARLAPRQSCAMASHTFAHRSRSLPHAASIAAWSYSGVQPSPGV